MSVGGRLLVGLVVLPVGVGAVTALGVGETLPLVLAVGVEVFAVLCWLAVRPLVRAADDEAARSDAGPGGVARSDVAQGGARCRGVEAGGPGARGHAAVRYLTDGEPLARSRWGTRQRY
ncbi:hypothetical protein [Streptomyces sp. NPDC088789]|uniref:hypothetical protein n=1 Tax=Streptomyces sp. NPDC088789 TaxID=3365899 RepID=UPI0037F45377